MKRLVLLLVPVAWLSMQSATPISAQSADEIVAKHIAARGGAEKFAAIQAVRITGRIKFDDNPFTPVTVLVTASGKFRLDLTAGGQAILQRYDGKTAWQGDQAVTGENATQILDQASSGITGPLWDYKNRHIQVEAGGTGKWRDHAAILLRLTLPTGTKMVMYLDPVTYLEIGEELYIKINGQPAVIEESVADDRRFGGVLFPCTFISNVRGQDPGQRLEIQNVEINPAIEDSVFRPK
jgi:outer membrane lipoprotein-sorting protein